MISFFCTEYIQEDFSCHFFLIVKFPQDEHHPEEIQGAIMASLLHFVVNKNITKRIYLQIKNIRGFF